MRHYQITVRNPTAAVVIAATALVVGGALLALGLTLFAGLALGGAALGAGAAIVRRLTGRRPVTPWDPAREVFPAPTDATHRIGRPD